MAIGSPQWMYASGEEYTLDQSLKFDNASDAYLSRTPASAGNRRTWTFSAWLKIGTPNTWTSIFSAGADGSNMTRIRIDDNGGRIFFDSEVSGSTQQRFYTSAFYRDTSAWYHFVLAVDTTQGTASNRVKMYVNGSQVTAFAQSDYPSQNYDYHINNTQAHYVGRQVGDTNGDWNGYMSEVNLIDGQALTPADFGETGDYGEWKPKEYSGTYGTNGFYLPFKQDYTVEGFSTVLYKCNNASQYIGGVGFKPDLVWIKQRIAGEHKLYDSVRGAYKSLSSDQTVVEDNYSDTLTAFNTDGFSLGADGTDGFVNFSGNNVAWNWDMGADTPTGFGCVTYTGNGAARTIAGLGFQPDLVWIKSRSNADSHNLFDAVRGTTKIIESDDTAAEYTNSGSLTSFDSDGFSFSTGTMSRVNGSGKTFVAWGWDMGGTTVTNTSGSENSTVRANPTYGQSIVSYEGNEVAGTTYGHGLNSAPELMIVKNRSRTSDWKVYYGDNTKALALNTNGATDDQTYYWNDTSPTSSVFTTGGGTDTNGNNENLVAYCFHSVSGYSKISSYTGSGSSGKVVTTGFRPAFVMVKRTTGEPWAIADSTRNPINPTRWELYANASDADYETGGSGVVNMTDTGFTIQATSGQWNASGGTYIYMAFAGGMDSISDYNTDGSIDSRVKANTTYGQSIVTWSGSGSTATIGHGLSSAPEAIIVKRRDASTNWPVWHTSISSGTDHFMDGLNLSSAKVTTASSFFTSTDPTSSVFSVGSGSGQTNSGDMVAYCFHSVTGYSKFGSFTGNGGSQTITTGFRPAFLLLKRSSNTSGWYILDNTRSPTNPAKKNLSPNSSSAESTASSGITFTDTGFQESGFINDNGETIIYMAFADKREYAYWLDQSGNNNDWTSNNLTESDISVDSPTNNFATLNPLDKAVSGTLTLSEGNLQAVDGSTSHFSVKGTMTSDSFYYEVYIKTTATHIIGVEEEHITHNQGPGKSAGSDATSGVGYETNTGRTIVKDVSSNTGLATFTTGDIMGIACNQSTIKFYKNGVQVHSESIASGGKTLIPSVGEGSNANVGSLVVNFGQDSSFAGNKTAQGNQDGNEIGDFYYTPPTGFLALCTKNLPDVDVVPSEHFNTVLYTGNGSDDRSISVGFQPDLVWLKVRSQAYNHYVYDSVRGANKQLLTNATNAEQTTGDRMQAFESNGFQLGTSGEINQNSQTYVGWNWKAGTSVSGNSSGSGTAQSYTGSVNSDAGFSIIKYTGNGTDGMQVPHHLGVVPDAIWIKSLTTQSWNCFFPNAIGADKGLQLDNTGPWGGPFSSTHLSDEMPTTSVVKLGNGAATNTYADGVGQDYIMYCWANKSGYSSIGGYVGNGNADGPFVYTGFKPAFLLIKVTGLDGEGWGMWDSARDIDNVVENRINADSSNAENSNDDWLDFLSNGFKIRETNPQVNSNGYTYVYMAFAENPFKYSNGE